jgi:hypothetical protein
MSFTEAVVPARSVIGGPGVLGLHWITLVAAGAFGFLTLIQCGKRPDVSLAAAHLNLSLRIDGCFDRFNGLPRNEPRYIHLAFIK